MARLDADLRRGEVAVETPAAFDAGLWFIGRIHTPWTARGDCPKRGDPVAGPVCRIELDPRWRAALDGLAGQPKAQILYWMHEARRDLVTQNPRRDERTAGTFALRSPVRPNPIASSVVTLIAIDGATLRVRGLDCLDGTPLVDIKPEHCPVS